MAKTKGEQVVDGVFSYFSWGHLFGLVLFMAFFIGTMQVLSHYDRAWKAADYASMTPYGQCLQECASVGSDDLCVEECRAYVIKDTGIDTRAVEVMSFFRAPITTSTAYQPQEVLAGHTVYNCDDNTNICEKINTTTTQTEQQSINIITDAPKASGQMSTNDKIFFTVAGLFALLVLGLILYKLVTCAPCC